MICKALISFGISVAVFFAIALGLILSQPVAPLPEMQSLDFDKLIGKAPVDPLPLVPVAMRDGWEMPTRHVAAKDKPLLVLIHGSGWHGQQFDALAGALRGQGEILAPDLRGHGATPGRRGDIDHMGQFDEDLADLIAAYRKPGQALIVAGHSSGGGLAIRFAGGAAARDVDHVILLSPFLKYNAPTVRENSGGWAHVLTRRIIGLSMLNMVGIRALNHLTMIQFSMPEPVLDGPMGHTATTHYSFRLNASFAPRMDYLGDIAKLPDFTLIAGREDEAFYAERFEPTMAAANPNGRYVILDGLGHLDVVDAPETYEIIKETLDAY